MKTAPLAVVMESTVEDDCPQVEKYELRENSIEIATALRALGYRTEIIPFSLDVAGIRSQLNALRPDMAFNLVDSIEGKGNLISLSPMLLAHLGIPYTGANALATVTTCDKLLTKQVLRSCDILTPGWLTERQIVKSDTLLASAYILKSITEHASFGMFADSVVMDSATLHDRWQEKKAKYGSEWFAEQYIDGREFNISIIADGEGARVLPCAEIVFTAEFPADKPRIVDYAAKWYEDSAESKGTIRNFDFKPQDKTLLATLERITLQCWELFGLTGYARVDFRLDAEDVPYVLEVNSNPFLTAQEGFGSAASRAGWSFTDVIRMIVSDAYRRAAKPLPVMLAA